MIKHSKVHLLDLAEKRAAIIGPLVAQGRISRVSRDSAAKQLNLSASQFNRLVSKYRRSGNSMMSLISRVRNRGRGKGRLSEQQEALMMEVISELYSTYQRGDVTRIVKEVQERALRLNIKLPSDRTIRRRFSVMYAIDKGTVDEHDLFFALRNF